MRTILVTGASRGIGKAIALQLASQGFAVVVHCRSRIEEAQAVCDAIVAAGGTARTLGFDVADRAAAGAALEADIKANGAYYGVVLNAGITRDQTFAALKPEAWDSVIHTNLDGFYNVLNPCLMPMIRLRQGGRIVVLASISGVIGNRGQVNYSASKAGLIGAAKALAVELASRQITVNAVAPGPIQTDMLDAAPVEEIKKMIPMERLGQPEEVAAAVGFLMSDGAAFISRQVLGVNGAMA